MDEIKTIPRNRYIGMLADALKSTKDATGVVGDFMLGDAPRTLDQWSYGFSPVRMGRTDQGLAGALYGMQVDPGLMDVAGVAGMVPGVAKLGTWAGREGLRAVDAAMMGGGRNNIIAKALSGVRPTFMNEPDFRALPESYFRRNANRSTPDNDMPWSMFSDNADAIERYGPVLWEFKPNQLQPSEILDATSRDGQREIVRGLLQDHHLVRQYGGNPKALAAEANPEDIVNSAGLWDSPDLVQHLYDTVLGPKGYRAVVTNNGALTFDPALARLSEKP